MLYFLSLIIILLPTYLIRFELFNIPTTLLEILIYLALIFQIIFDRKIILPKNKKIIISLGMILLSSLIAIYIAPEKNVALGQFKAFIVDPIIFIWLLWRVEPRRFEIRPTILCDSLIISSMIMSVYAISQKLLDITTNDGRVVGIFSYEPNSSPNYLAMYLAPVLAISVLSLFRSKRYKIYYLVSSFIILVGIYLTGSRGAILANLIAIFIVLWKYYSDTKGLTKKVNLFLSTGLVIIFLISIYSAQINPIAPEGSGRISNSNNIRYEIWKTTFEIETKSARNFFLGLGLGNYQTYFTDLTSDRVNYPEFISPRALMPHNLFLSFWVQGGMLMLIAYSYFLILALIKSFKNKKYQVLAGLITITIAGLVDTPFWKNDLVIIFWILILLGIVSKPKQLKK